MCVIQGQRPPTLPPNDNYIRIRVCARTYCPLVHQPRRSLLDGSINVLKCISTIRFPFFLLPSRSWLFPLSLSLSLSLSPYLFFRSIIPLLHVHRREREKRQGSKKLPLVRRDLSQGATCKEKLRVKWGNTEFMYNKIKKWEKLLIKFRFI